MSLKTLLARHVADIVIPTSVAGMALPGALAPRIDVGDSGQTLLERVDDAGDEPAHERAGVLSAQANTYAEQREARWTPVTAGDQLQ